MGFALILQLSACGGGDGNGGSSSGQASSELKAALDDENRAATTFASKTIELAKTFNKIQPIIDGLASQKIQAIIDS